MAQSFNYREYLASREWAILKNQTRERAGGQCERCYQAAAESTHHLTYERIGRERLEDLLAVCNPCHEFLSGKSEYDPAAAVLVPAKNPAELAGGMFTRYRVDRPAPATKPIVYLAGKIAKNDWRHTIFGGLRGVAGPGDIVTDPIEGHSRITELRVPQHELTADGVVYGGPYFVSCDHGCFHGDGKHGQVDGCNYEGVRPFSVAFSCLELISKADYVFCWLDAADAYGTLVELGYARALEKTIRLYIPKLARTQQRWQEDMWFARAIAHTWVEAENVETAWRWFVNDVRLAQVAAADMRLARGVTG